MTSNHSGIFARSTFSLIFVCFTLSLGQTTFGYDTGLFNGLQVIPGFLSRFGTCKNDVCTLDTNQTALGNSLAFLGKGIGTLTVGTFIEYFGHRWAMVAMAAFNYIGAVVEITANGLPQFASTSMNALI
jgi:MFS transporter, SP family, sugar:H+ symporter